MEFFSMEFFSKWNFFQKRIFFKMEFFSMEFFSKWNFFQWNFFQNGIFFNGIFLSEFLSGWRLEGLAGPTWKHWTTAWWARPAERHQLPLQPDGTTLDDSKYCRATPRPPYCLHMPRGTRAGTPEPRHCSKPETTAGPSWPAPRKNTQTSEPRHSGVSAARSGAVWPGRGAAAATGPSGRGCWPSRRANWPCCSCCPWDGLRRSCAGARRRRSGGRCRGRGRGHGRTWWRSRRRRSGAARGPRWCCYSRRRCRRGRPSRGCCG